MSDDGTRRCGSEDENAAALYTLLPINHKHAASMCDDDDDNVSVNFRQHRNRNRINRDISCVRRRKCSEDAKGTCNHHQQQQQHSSTIKSSRSYRLINLCLVIAFHMICNEFVTSVNCDELLDSVGARGHYTHTWAVHIPGGDEVAQQVAADHGMNLRGKVN
jgi:Peptidase S8 pro-domain